MIAKFRNGKIISGRLAETFTRIGLTTEITDEEVTELNVINPKQTNKKGRPKVKKNEKDS